MDKILKLKLLRRYLINSSGFINKPVSTKETEDIMIKIIEEKPLTEEEEKKINLIIGDKNVTRKF